MVNGPFVGCWASDSACFGPFQVLTVCRVLDYGQAVQGICRGWAVLLSLNVGVGAVILEWRLGITAAVLGGAWWAIADQRKPLANGPSATCQGVRVCGAGDQGTGVVSLMRSFGVV